MTETGLSLRVLSERALDQIEDTAYRLLAEVGISLEHAPAREMLYGQGCRIERDRVLFPASTVQWALDSVQPIQEVYNREGVPVFCLGEGGIRFHSGGSLPFLRDLDTGARRQPLLSDVVDGTRLLDSLPNVDVIIPLFSPQDVPPELLTIVSTAAALRNTTKPLWSAPIDRPEHVPYVVEMMMMACCGGPEAFMQRPTTCLMVSPVSPLIFTDDVAGSILAIAESGAPLLPLPAPSLGATGPVTMAGALAQQHAETVAAFVLAAAARPGVRVAYCSRISAIDPRTAVSIWGGPEVGMTGAASAQLAHRLGLPCDSYGLSSSASELDPQFAYERLANALVPALAGVDIISGAGSTGNVMIAGLDIAVMDNEIIGLIKQVAGGCEVNETTLAFDVMREVIPRDGVFLGELHTVKQMRQGALWISQLSIRTEAEAGGVVARAQAQARQLLASHRPEPLADDTEQALDEILARARRELKGD